MAPTLLIDGQQIEKVNAMSQPIATIQTFIDKLVRSTGASSPEEAVRLKARELMTTYQTTLGDPEMPIDVDVLASLQGIHASDDLPIQSPDAELVPRTGGGLKCEFTRTGQRRENGSASRMKSATRFFLSMRSSPGVEPTHVIDNGTIPHSTWKCFVMLERRNCYFPSLGLERTRAK